MSVLRYSIDSAAEGARKRIGEWNDGIFRNVQFLDAVGPLPRLMKICVTLEKQGDTLYFNFDGTSPEVMDRAANAIPIGIISIQMTYFMACLFSDLPHNSGILEPLHYKLPEGSLLNATRESPKAGSPFTMNVNRQVIWQVIQKAIFSTMRELVLAQPAHTFNTVVYGGLNQYGAPFADVGAEMNADGFGARFDKDGVHVAGASFAPMSSEPGEVESLEAALPFLYLYRGLHRDSCGYGKFRGGLGMNHAIAVYDVPWIFFGSGDLIQRQRLTGLFGGYASPVAPFVRISNSNLKENAHSSEKKLPHASWATYEERTINGLYEADKYPSPPRPVKGYDIVAGGSLGRRLW